MNKMFLLYLSVEDMLTVYLILRIAYWLTTLTFLVILLRFYNIRKIPRCGMDGDRDISLNDMSIIIPVRNDRENLIKLLENIVGGDYEVIIVDDESTDGTFEAAENFCESHNCKVVRVEKPGEWMGKPYACHVGVEISKGRYILFLDSDILINLESIRCIRSQLGRFEAVSGLPRFKCRNILSSLVEYAFNTLVGLFYPPWKLGEGGRPWLAGAIMGWRRESYEKIGGHRRVYSSLVEDAELGEIAVEEGIKVGFVRGGWITSIGGSYRDFESFLTRLMTFIKADPRDIYLLLLFSVAVNIMAYTSPLLVYLGLVSLYDATVFLAALWLIPLSQVIADLLKPRLPSLLIYPIGFIILSILLLKASVSVRRGEGEIYWRGRKIKLGGYKKIKELGTSS
jgi:glycosyltransferase involved in cell wall biosynthesis